MYKSIKISAFALTIVAISDPSQARGFFDFFERANDWFKGGVYRICKPPISEDKTESTDSLVLRHEASNNFVNIADKKPSAHNNFNDGGTLIVDPNIVNSYIPANVNNILKLKFSDTIFLQKASTHSLQREVNRRMREDQRRKHPYLGFKSIKDENGMTSGTLSQGVQALFEVR